jgi:polyisoprenyl-phosphate glycosyltransferase
MGDPDAIAGAVHKRRPVITVLTPVFNEQDNLERYYQTVRAVLLDNPDYQFEIIIIDDGSRDGSWQQIAALCVRDPRLRALRLSRNFGSHIAISAGFAHARGDAVATLACDLQDPPQVVVEFAHKWAAGAQIVWGHRQNRDDPWWRSWASRMFSRLIARHALPKDSLFATGSFFLVDRKVADCFNQFPERNRITFALVAWSGFSQDRVWYQRAARMAGQSGWTFAKMIRAMYDAFVGFSALPVRLMTWIGGIAFLFTFGLSTHVFINRLVGDPVPGWSGIMIALSTCFGVQFLLMGVVGEYLYRIYAEVVRRPLFFVQEQIRAPRIDERAPPCKHCGR